jgi:signal transduction histidine kinase
MTAAFQQQEPNRPDPAALSAGTPDERRAEDASHLAHDARNWLTVLRVYCDLLRSSGAVVAGQGRTWIEELSNAVERGQGLVTSLLDSAQQCVPLESSRVDAVATVPKMLNLAAILQKRESLYQSMAGSRIRVEIKTVERAETTALPESELDRILLNLVRNGIDAMPCGGRLKIELKHGDASQRRTLVLCVTDTGNGIPADILSRIFDSGFSTKSTARDPKSGRGYGLAIVRELTLAAGGSVRVHSTIGRGACFTLELPVQLAPSTPRHRISQPGNVADASKNQRQTTDPSRQDDNFGAHQKGTRVPC